MAGGVEVAKAFVTIIPTTKGAQGEITKAIVPEAESAGTQAGGKIGSGLMGALKKFAVPAAVFTAIAAIGKFAVESFQEVEAGANNVIIATGATGDAADALISTYKDVARNVVGDFEDIGSAVGELNTRFGLQGDALEAASEQAMKYAKVTGQDATQAVQDVSRMMNNAGISADEYALVLDKLTVAGQQAGIDVGKLAQSVNDNAASFTAMGFSTDEAIAMLANFEKSGANTSQILAGMKKGVSEWAKEGKSAGDGFAEFVAGVQDGSIDAAGAIEIFGARAGTAMYDAAKKGQLDYSQMLDAITSDSAGALDQVYNDTLTASEKIDLAWQNIKLGAADAIEPLMNAIGDVLTDYVVPAAQQAGRWLGSIGEKAAPYIQPLLSGLQQVGTFIMGIVTPIAQFLAPILQVVFTILARGFQLIGQGLSYIFGWLNDNVVPAVQAFFDFINPTLQQFAAWFQTNWPTIQQVISTVWNKIKAVTTTVWNAIQRLVQSKIIAVQHALYMLRSAVAVVKKVFNAIKEAITHPIETAKNVIKGIVDTIKGFFNFTMPTPHIKLPHFSIQPAGWKVSDLLEGKIPTLGISWYARGGIFEQPSIIGVGEAGTEVVAPLSKLEDMLEVSGGGNTTNIYIDGATVNDDSAIESAFYRFFDLLVRRNKLAHGVR